MLNLSGKCQFAWDMHEAMKCLRVTCSQCQVAVPWLELYVSTRLLGLGNSNGPSPYTALIRSGIIPWLVGCGNGILNGALPGQVDF